MTATQHRAARSAAHRSSKSSSHEHDGDRTCETRRHRARDYKAVNQMVRRQRAALTRARNSGDPEQVILACRDALREWNTPGSMWPDDWGSWQRALDDVLPLCQQVSLGDLAD